MIVYHVFGAFIPVIAALYSLTCRLHRARPRLIAIRRRGRHAAPRPPRDHRERADILPGLEVANA
ncbi:hypothetical protein [Actinomadura alba]|uniref:Uncharacterized protein n=1 Tax=Actinomadura alba TaxID=406431 RepID=A0ABR7LHH2_9ACTN|nr:hypothetical protein [Actinomadura alba]MBC6464287.1 hypothetical protein [Actinomadura alba]